MAEASLIEFTLVLPPPIEFCLGVSAMVVAPSPVPMPAVLVVIGPAGDRGPAGPAYDQTSPTDGIAIIGDALRIDIASLPLAD